MMTVQGMMETAQGGVVVVVVVVAGRERDKRRILHSWRASKVSSPSLRTPN
ncbi:hypothetical protein E2C01_043931 [Portunus trituberculatus]|uniref:Uncharacterized protein n=1 Tax=Portunus trituberculatus TaxID=210409 RepID=A0A5B7FY24_PORTR|nr:hypothetical protein [Portunus trituberculatus]